MSIQIGINPAALNLLLCRLLALPLGRKLNAQRPRQLAQHLWIGDGLAAFIFLQTGWATGPIGSLMRQHSDQVNAAQHATTGALADPAVKAI